MALGCDGHLMTESAPTYLLFEKSCSVYHLPVFNSQEFKLLVSDMRKVQDDWANKRIEVPPMVGSQLEKLVYTAVTPHLKHLEDVMLNVVSKVDKLAAIQHPPGSGTGAIGHENQNSGVSEQLTATEFLDFLADGKTPRKRKRAVSRSADFDMGKVPVLMSTENKTLDDFWQEFAHGQNGNIALMLLEAKGMGWWRDPEGSGKFEVFWGYRNPIYKLVTHYMESTQLSEEEALDMVRPLFDSIPKSRSGKPNLKVLSKLFTLKLKKIKNQN
jgi:hypothetical protein